MIETAQSEINSERTCIADINNQVSELSVLIASKVLKRNFRTRSKELVDKYLKRQAINNGKCSK